MRDILCDIFLRVGDLSLCTFYFFVSYILLDTSDTSDTCIFLSHRHILAVTVLFACFPLADLVFTHSIFTDVKMSNDFELS